MDIIPLKDCRKTDDWNSLIMENMLESLHVQMLEKDNTAFQKKGKNMIKYK